MCLIYSSFPPCVGFPYSLPLTKAAGEGEATDRGVNRNTSAMLQSHKNTLTAPNSIFSPPVLFNNVQSEKKS